MSRLDYHVTKVQSKMLLSGMLLSLAWSLLFYAGIVWLAILVGKLFQIYLPRQLIWLYAGLGVAVAIAVGIAVMRRPTRKHAAVAIDERLGLKERFSTALYARPSSGDPFAAAAVRDAESVAERVHLQDKFPIRFPRVAVFTLAVIGVAALTQWLLQPMDLFGRKEQAAKAALEQQRTVEAKREVQQALAKIEAMPPAVQKDEKIQLAVKEMRQFLDKPGRDPTVATKTAQSALEDVKTQMQKIKQMQNVAAAMNDMKAWRELASKPIDESGPVGKAHSEMAKGEFSKAVDMLKHTVNNFDKMDQPEKDKAADQMGAMAQKLADMANDPKVQEEVKKQLQQMGANQQLAQQMANAMQQAANGDKQAARQLQQMANQVMQQMNQGQGPTQQQIQQAQAMLQKLQMQANGQAQAQQLANSALALAKSMQQAAQAGQQAQQNAAGQPQQANAGQQGSGKPQGGQGQPQQGGQNAQQQAQAQMRQQMAQMQAMADAAQQQAGGAGAGQQAGGGQQGGAEGTGIQPQQGQQQAQAGQAGGAEGGQFQKGDPNGQGAGFGGPGQANGGGPKPQVAPFGVKQELSPSETIERGKILAANYVKAASLKGESKMQMQEVIESQEAEAADEVDQSRVSRQAREAVKEYNRSIGVDQPAATEEAPAK